MGRTHIAEQLLEAVENKNNRTIPFLDFHQCIVDGDVGILVEVLSEVASHKENILNSEIIYPEEAPDTDRELQFQIPLALAAASGNTDMLQLLLSHGADVTLTDSQGSNILHSLVILSDDFPQTACMMYSYIVENINTGVLQQLHSARNEKGLPPLDLAADLCVPEILQLILTTEQVYRFKLSQRGLLTKYEYKIHLHDDYTFLHRICAASKTEVGRFSKVSFFHMEPMKTIITEIDRRYRQYTPLITGTIYTILYQIYLYMFLSTHAIPPRAFTATLLSYLCILIINEGVSISIGDMPRRLFAKAKTGKKPYVFTISFIVPLLMCWTFTLILLVVELVGVDSMTLRTALYSLTAGLSFTPFLFFLQLSSTFSHLGLMIEKMFWEIVKFLVMTISLLTTFTMAFYVLSVAPNGIKPSAVNATQESLPETIVITAYETFLLTFAGRSLDDIFFAHSAIPVMSIIVYIMCVLEGAVLLLNLLIAIFSHQVEDVYRYRYEIQMMFKIQTMLVFRTSAIARKRIKAKIMRKQTVGFAKEELVFTIMEKNSAERQEDQ